MSDKRSEKTLEADAKSGNERTALRAFALDYLKQVDHLATDAEIRSAFEDKAVYEANGGSANHTAALAAITPARIARRDGRCLERYRGANAMATCIRPAFHTGDHSDW